MTIHCEQHHRSEIEIEDAIFWHSPFQKEQKDEENNKKKSSLSSYRNRNLVFTFSSCKTKMNVLDKQRNNKINENGREKDYEKRKKWEVDIISGTKV